MIPKKVRLSVLRLNLWYAVKYSPFPLTKGYICPFIPFLVLIQLQESLSIHHKINTSIRDQVGPHPLFLPLFETLIHFLCQSYYTQHTSNMIHFRKSEGPMSKIAPYRTTSETPHCRSELFWTCLDMFGNNSKMLWFLLLFLVTFCICLHHIA